MDFTQVYGDTFISGKIPSSGSVSEWMLMGPTVGFQEGGEFNALVSIKVKDKTQKENIKAEYDDSPEGDNHG